MLSILNFVGAEIAKGCVLNIPEHMQCSDKNEQGLITCDWRNSTVIFVERQRRARHILRWNEP